MRPIETGACQQRGLAAVDERMHAVAVVLDLVHPVLAARRSSTRRVSCGLIHLGGRDVVPTELLEHTWLKAKTRNSVGPTVMHQLISNQAQPSSFSAQPAFQILVMWRILSPSKAMQ